MMHFLRIAEQRNLLPPENTMIQLLLEFAFVFMWVLFYIHEVHILYSIPLYKDSSTVLKVSPEVSGKLLSLLTLDVQHFRTLLFIQEINVSERQIF